MILLITMVFAAFEIFFFFKAWLSFFGGLEAIGDTEAHHRVFDKWKMIRNFTLVFSLVKAVIAFLPDLTLLDDARYGEVTGTGIASWQDYRAAFTIFAFVIVLIVGIVWLALSIAYFRLVKKESDFTKVLNKRVEAYYSTNTTLAFRHSLLALSFLLYAFVFCLELKIEGYSLLPPMISAALFFIFFCLMRKVYRKEALIGMISSAVYFVLSLVSWVKLYLFADEYYLEDAGFGFSETIIDDIDGTFAVFDEYFAINVWVAISQVAFLVLLFASLAIMKKLIAEKTGMPESMIDEKDKTDAMRHHEEIAERDAKRAIVRTLPPFVIGGVLSALSCAVFPLLQIYFPSFFTIDLVIRILFVMLAAASIAKLRQGIKVKAALDLE